MHPLGLFFDFRNIKLISLRTDVSKSDMTPSPPWTIAQFSCLTRASMNCLQAPQNAAFNVYTDLLLDFDFSLKFWLLLSWASPTLSDSFTPILKVRFSGCQIGALTLLTDLKISLAPLCGLDSGIH